MKWRFLYYFFLIIDVIFGGVVPCIEGDLSKHLGTNARKKALLLYTGPSFSLFTSFTVHIILPDKKHVKL